MYKSLIYTNKKFFKQTIRKFAESKLSNTTSTNPNFRVEYDTFGPVNVPTDKYWAAQTQRSLQNFAIGTKEDKMPISVVRAMAIIKKCAAKVK
jgi:fumarate hydratase class II